MTADPVGRIPVEARGRAPLLLATAVLVAGAIALVIAWGVQVPIHAILIWLLGLVCIVGVYVNTANGLRPTAVVFLVFTFSWLVFAPAVQLKLNLAAWNDTFVFSNSPRVTEGLALNLVGITAFLLGDLVLRRRDGRAQSAPPRSGERGRIPTVAVYVVGFLLLAVVPLAIRSNGGIGTFFSTRDDRSQVLAGAGLDLASAGGVQLALITLLPSGLAVAGGVLTAERLRRALRGDRRGLTLRWLEFGFFAVGIVVFANPFSNTRFLAAAAIGSLVLIALQPRSRSAAFAFAAVVVTATLVLYPVSAIFRSSGTSVAYNGLDVFAGPDFDGFQQVLNTITYVQGVGHSGGIYLLSALAYFVPRSAWPDKAVPSSLDVASYTGYDFTNLSEPVHAELYLEFGWIGAVVGMFLLGLAVSRIDRAWLEQRGMLAVLAPYASLTMLSVMRGPLGAQVPVYLTVLIIVAIGASGRARPADRPLQST